MWRKFWPSSTSISLAQNSRPVEIQSCFVIGWNCKHARAQFICVWPHNVELIWAVPNKHTSTFMSTMQCLLAWIVDDPLGPCVRGRNAFDFRYVRRIRAVGWSENLWVRNSFWKIRLYLYFCQNLVGWSLPNPGSDSPVNVSKLRCGFLVLNPRFDRCSITKG